MIRTALALLALAAPAWAQTFTSAAEVKPILTATKPNWVAVREWEGQDVVYFNNQILSWRCGLTGFAYSITGATPKGFDMPPCHDGTSDMGAFSRAAALIP